MTLRRPSLVAMLAGVALATVAAPAATQAQGIAPPGNSAVDQYVESVPSADGPRNRSGSATSKPATPADAPGGDGADAVPQAESAEPAATSPESAGTADGGRTDRARRGRATTGATPRGEAARRRAASTSRAAAQPPSVPSAVLQAIGSPAPGGMGVLLPALMAGTLVAGIGIAFSRRSRR